MIYWYVCNEKGLVAQGRYKREALYKMSQEAGTLVLWKTVHRCTRTEALYVKIKNK